MSNFFYKIFDSCLLKQELPGINLGFAKNCENIGNGKERIFFVNFVRVCKDEDLLLCVLNEDCVSLFVVDVSSWVLRNTHKTLTPTYDKHRS